MCLSLIQCIHSSLTPTRFSKIANINDEPLEIEYGQAIGQMLIIPIETPEIEETDITKIHAKASDRGATGGILGNSQ